MPRLLAILCACVTTLLAAPEPEVATPSEIHLRRAEKIVAPLTIDDENRAARVRVIVAGQYHALSFVHAERDSRLAAIKSDAALDDAARRIATSACEDRATAALARLHFAYLAALSAELSADQIEQIKDAMTYGVAPNTYRVYLEMVPSLDDAQKRQILALLHEAREHAMCAGSAEEKHRWFGKYKGRINNTLARSGIDLKQAERDMRARGGATR